MIVDSHSGGGAAELVVEEGSEGWFCEVGREVAYK
jgi:hypothetical protein